MIQHARLTVAVVLATFGAFSTSDSEWQAATSRLIAADNVLSDQERADGWVLLFDGKTTKGWMTPKGQPLPDKHVQDGSLNPHPCDYMLVYDKVWENFRLSLDFKITTKCNSGIFIRTFPLTPRPGKDVGFNGLEIAIDDTREAGYHDTGAIYDLVRPKKNAMKPAGEWNHIVVTCDRNLIEVELNDEAVTRMDLDEWTEPNKRPDGSAHKFDVAYKTHPRKGYLGLQDHGSDCWFKNIKLLPRAAAQTGKVTMEVTERVGRVPVPCRVHFKNGADEPQRPPGLPFWNDHFVCPGTVELELPAGSYTFEVERGPEYRTASGSVTVQAGKHEHVRVELERLANMAAEGWWSGEMHVHRPIEQIELLVQAEDLHVAPVISWWNNRNLWASQPPPDQPLVRFDGDRFYHLTAGEDEREGGALLYFNLPRPLAIAGSSREYPSPMKFVAEARRASPDVWIDVEKPFWWDVPVWLASGQVNSIGLANNHMCRSRMYETEAWGKPRDATRLPPPLGNGLWSQEIYYHILNCGLRLPPSAGSASGVLPNPVGYNRIYAYLGDQFDYESWWQAVRAGHTFVTNGPLLRVPVEGQMPGHVFTAPAGAELTLNLFIDLISRDPIARVEIIQNGRVARTVTADDWSKTDTLGTLRFTESGWFLVRAIADNANTFRFASTAPYYVEIGPVKHRISKSSAQFFLDWVNERIARVKLDDPQQRQEVLEHHERARTFWQERVHLATAE